MRDEKDFHQGLDYYEVVRHSAAALVVYRPRVLTYRRTVITILYLRLLLPRTFQPSPSCTTTVPARDSVWLARDSTVLRVASRRLLHHPLHRQFRRQAAHNAPSWNYSVGRNTPRVSAMIICRTRSSTWSTVKIWQFLHVTNERHVSDTRSQIITKWNIEDQYSEKKIFKMV